jgi:hypothetical protein
MMTRLLWVLSFLVLLLGKVPEEGRAQGTKKRGGPLVDLDGFKAQPFESWKLNDKEKVEKPLLYRFLLPAGKDDRAEGEILIKELDPAATPRQVFDELKKLMKPPEGKKIEDVCHESELKKADLHILEFFLTNGTFAEPGPPGPRKIDEARVLAAFVDTKGGKYLVRLVGPRQIVSAATPDLEAFLKDLKK